MAQAVNTRQALWPDRWPAIALQVCIDEVEAAPPDQQSAVKWNLPCDTCPSAGACLNAKRKELGPLLFDREILTQPRSSESSLFPMEMFDPLLDRETSMVPQYRKPYSIESYYGVCTAWDVAWSEKIGGDYLVKMTGLVDRRSGQRSLLDINRWTRLTFEQQMTLIEAEHARYGDDIVVIESDFAQAIWSQYLSATTAVPVLPHAASDKKDMLLGIPGLLLQLEQKKWRFPYRAGSYHYEEMRTFLAELEAFGWTDGKLEGVGEHDDTVMAWYHLAWGLDRLMTPMGHTGRKVPGGGRSL